jgi:hypothetical protein
MKLKAIFFSVCLMTGLAIGLAFAADNGPAKIDIDINGKGKAVKGFDHAKHQGMADLKCKCNTCHHKTKAGKKPQKCSACHTDVKKGKDGAPGFKDAFHKACKDCHKKKDKKLAKCKACHNHK